MVVDSPGAILDSLDISSTVNVFADNVTIRRSRINGSGYYVVKTYDGVTYFKNLTITDSELDGQGVLADTSIAVMATDGAQILRDNIHGMTSSGPRLASNETVRDSWIHDFVCGPGIHQAGMSANDGGSNITVRHNTLDINTTDAGCASFAFELALDFGYYTNVVVDNNLLNGGAYCTQAGIIAPQNQYSGLSTKIQYTNNSFGTKYRPQCGEYGPVSEWGVTSGNVWAGNVWAGTSTPVVP